ncbi:hypothetical protein AB0C70_34670 [Streptomyces sp. NPDC048564]|uniref:hypothetical protein n=1 Tax=Streptomyces sp. NPDC048564 TaxID=3155760 RepID=UPI00343AB162
MSITEDGRLNGASLKPTSWARRKHTVVLPKRIDSLELIIDLLEAGRGLRIAQPADQGARLVTTRQQDHGVLVRGSRKPAVAAALTQKMRETIKVLATEQERHDADAAAAAGEWLAGRRVRGADDRTRSESIHTLRGGLPTLGRRR